MIATKELIPELEHYFSGLSPETRSRFAPHGFDEGTLQHLLGPDSGLIAFVAKDVENGSIIGYAVARLYYESYELDRFHGYGWLPDEKTDAFYAPSVADAYQGRGIGKQLMLEAIDVLRSQGRSRMLLWGGVQATNEKALAHYRKAGFQELGTFEWNGRNIDMVLLS